MQTASTSNWAFSKESPHCICLSEGVWIRMRRWLVIQRVKSSWLFAVLSLMIILRRRSCLEISVMIPKRRGFIFWIQANGMTTIISVWCSCTLWRRKKAKAVQNARCCRNSKSWGISKQTISSRSHQIKTKLIF